MLVPAGALESTHNLLGSLDLRLELLPVGLQFLDLARSLGRLRNGTNQWPYEAQDLGLKFVLFFLRGTHLGDVEPGRQAGQSIAQLLLHRLQVHNPLRINRLLALGRTEFQFVLQELLRQVLERLVPDGRCRRWLLGRVRDHARHRVLLCARSHFRKTHEQGEHQKQQAAEHRGGA